MKKENFLFFIKGKGIETLSLEFFSYPSIHTFSYYYFFFLSPLPFFILFSLHSLLSLPTFLLTPYFYLKFIKTLNFLSLSP